MLISHMAIPFYLRALQIGRCRDGGLSPRTHVKCASTCEKCATYVFAFFSN